ncbi:hypothetical protein [Ilumatobacter nonamiensis]|uniref:hypothetical protein n=1 Tax=Ilumatobacter nonamiensis TaxID=467093 RepID=UPI00034D8584|nr:hypothetical protein [Ilumatobacter nonamiensis]
MVNNNERGAFSQGMFIFLIIVSILIGLVGIIVGAINLSKPGRRTQSIVLLAVGVASILLGGLLLI